MIDVDGGLKEPLIYLFCNKMFALPAVHHMILMYELGKHYRKTLSVASTVIQTD